MTYESWGLNDEKGIKSFPNERNSKCKGTAILTNLVLGQKTAMVVA